MTNPLHNTAADPDVHGHTILIIDDDPNNLAILSDHLEEAGLKTLVAEDGESGLKRAEYALPDLIILDVLMPGMDGFEACRRLKELERTKDIPVIFMTALAEMVHKVKGFAAGGVDYITKPFQTEEVLARITTHLSLRTLQKQLETQNDHLQLEIAEHLKTRQALQKAHDELEERVERRTAELREEIAERIQVEKLQHIYASIVAATSDLMSFVGKDYTYHAVNEAYLFAHQIIRDAIVGSSAAKLHGDKVFMEVIKPELDKCLAGAPVRYAAWFDYPGLGRRFMDVTYNPYKDQKGEISGVVVCVHDLTEQRRLEEQLRQSVKMEAIGTLAGGVAHDFNNLLTIILGNSDIALQRIDKDNPFIKNIEQIRRAGQRAALLTSQLLAFSRKQVVQPKVINLNEVIADTEKMLKRLIGEDIDLVSMLDSRLARVMADPGLIEQVIINIAINARDAMPHGGKLTIETVNVYLGEDYARHHLEVVPGHYAMVAVSDTGCGMDEATLSHIFEPFFTTKTKGKGTGLGLSVVFGIVKQSGGHIWVYSEPGNGTTFKVYLPTVEQDPESLEAGAEREEPPVGGGETVLLVEDDDAVRDLAGGVLREYGYTVYEAHDGYQALKLYNSHEGPIHLLVTDVVMPGMNGRELAQKIESLRPALKVLFVSGYTDNAIVHHGVLDAGTAFLQKPFTPEALARKVREVIDSR
jgi:DNA-binding response OmpR family regulator/signal transduction histidine kinase